MNIRKMAITLICLLAAIGCQSFIPRQETKASSLILSKVPDNFLNPNSNLRLPSSIVAEKEWEELRVLKQKRLELGALSVRYDAKKNKSKLKKVRAEISVVDSKILGLEARISSFQNPGTRSILYQENAWRVEKERIELKKIDLYEIEKNVEFSISTYEAKKTEVNLSQRFFSSAGYEANAINSAHPMINFTVVCDASFEVKKLTREKKIKANRKFKFSLGDEKISNGSFNLIFTPDLNTCDFKFTSSEDESKRVYGFKLVNEKNKLGALKNILARTEVCTLKKGTDTFFETTEFFNMTCPTKYDSIELLKEPEDSLHARVVSLIGQDLPKDFIKNGNPYAELDFSKAPKYDALLVSYLVFKADFYGTLLARLLAYHADHGALVRIMVADVITFGKDKNMYEKLMALHPNVKVVRYHFDRDQKNGSWFSEFHRTNHVKLFVAYSNGNPKNSFVIVGGRNVHDGFVFRKPIDVSRFPEIVNYSDEGESWAYWRDFEMAIHGQEFAESAVRHYMSFYHLNKENLAMKLTSVAVKKDDALESDEQSLRHYVSIPFKDEPNLNLFYARLIDTAKNKILISSPYFRPVKEIGDALDRAIARGVDITIITRLDLEGDTADFILGAVNKDGVNKYLKKVKVYEYTEPKVILHSKLLMIDEEVSFISSVNLNKRSFYHDLENGVLVNDRHFTVDMEKLYREYLTISKQLNDKMKIVFWKKILIKALDKVF